MKNPQIDVKKNQNNSVENSIHSDFNQNESLLSARKNQKSLIIIGLIILNFIVLLVIGIYAVQYRYKTRMVMHSLDVEMNQKDELNIEHAQLLLEESTFATGIVLDQNINRYFNMYLPKIDQTTYIHLHPNKK